MKKLVIYTILATLLAGCSDDDCTTYPEDNVLITPKIYMNVATANGQSPLTGILTISPCNACSSIYFGNYVDDKLTPFYADYQVKDGTFYDEAKKRELSLPAGTYNMIYWGTPKYETPVYAYPAISPLITGMNQVKQ